MYNFSRVVEGILLNINTRFHIFLLRIDSFQINIFYQICFVVCIGLIKVALLSQLQPMFI